MLIFSDLHLREDSADVVLGEVLPGILDACVKAGESVLACLGDFYHFRYRIDVRIQNEVRAWLQRVARAGISVHLLPGNHDQVDFIGRNALEVFADYTNVRVYTEPTWTEVGLWIPYRKDPNDIAKALALPAPQGFQSAPRVLFMHHGVRGAFMSNTMLDTEGLPLEWFQSWSRVLCGHYHKRQDLGQLTYIGSPWQTKADEAGQPKGFAFWNGRELKFEDKRWGPRYADLEVGPGAMELALKYAGSYGPRDIVRIRTAPGIDPGAVGAAFAAKGATVVVTPEVVIAEARIQLPESSSLADYAAKYVELTPTSLDKTKLMAVFKELTQ